MNQVANMLNIKVHVVHPGPALGFTPWLVMWQRCDHFHSGTLDPKIQANFPGHGHLTYVPARHSEKKMHPCIPCRGGTRKPAFEPPRLCLFFFPVIPALFPLL